MPGGTEWIVIGAVVVLLFGAKKLPDLAHSLGRSSREFKKGLKGEEEARPAANKDEDAAET
jgi:sec-independent protein translocase protein TatA